MSAKNYLHEHLDYAKEYSKNQSFRAAWSHYDYVDTIEYFDIYQRKNYAGCS